MTRKVIRLAPRATEQTARISPRAAPIDQVPLDRVLCALLLVLDSAYDGKADTYRRTIALDRLHNALARPRFDPAEIGRALELRACAYHHGAERCPRPTWWVDPLGLSWCWTHRGMGLYRSPRRVMRRGER